ncbi:MAG: dTDP-4-amino-4,6-dideoxygalactose transaminase [Spirochaetaceae bacterium]|nr:dTDP-4-amino-4,6-dideoxygalactose transaminase [Spirochaetaceae bacterium]
MEIIRFSKPCLLGFELENICRAFEQGLCGDGFFTKKCHAELVRSVGVQAALLTPSCTHALEMAAMLLDIKDGDEVIMPSFTFVSTANAFVIRGAKIVFVDIRPDTMNIDEKVIEEAITDRTKAIVPVHYAGVSCEMDRILEIAQKYNICVIEDAAQGIGAAYKGRRLGSIGDMGCYSFHETKNITCGEGGALLLRDKKYIERSEIIREKGTDRSRFYRGQVDKYTWIDIGSSYLPSELCAAYLYSQLENLEMVTNDRLKTWNNYYEYLKPLLDEGRVELPLIPKDCEHNAHIFFIKVKDIEERGLLINFLKERQISAVFHYIPLHSSPAGMKYGKFYGNDIYTSTESARLLRLPLWYGMDDQSVKYITDALFSFFKERYTKGYNYADLIGDT